MGQFYWAWTRYFSNEKAEDDVKSNGTAIVRRAVLINVMIAHLFYIVKCGAGFLRVR
jgi:hypothetical protein